MLSIRSSLLVFAFAIPFAVSAQNSIDLSGTWRMDPERSESAHQEVPIGPITLIIKQSPTEVSIETRRRESNKTTPHVEVLTYKLDGTESIATGSNRAAVKCKAHWDGAKLVTETTRDIQGATISTLYTHTLDITGNELTIHKTLTVQHGYQFAGAKSYGTGIDVFVRLRK